MQAKNTSAIKDTYLGKIQRFVCQQEAAPLPHLVLRHLLQDYAGTTAVKSFFYKLSRHHKNFAMQLINWEPTATETLADRLEAYFTKLKPRELKASGDFYGLLSAFLQYYGLTQSLDPMHHPKLTQLFKFTPPLVAKVDKPVTTEVATSQNAEHKTVWLTRLQNEESFDDACSELASFTDVLSIEQGSRLITIIKQKLADSRGQLWTTASKNITKFVKLIPKSLHAHLVDSLVALSQGEHLTQQLAACICLGEIYPLLEEEVTRKTCIAALVAMLQSNQDDVFKAATMATVRLKLSVSEKQLSEVYAKLEGHYKSKKADLCNAASELLLHFCPLYTSSQRKMLIQVLLVSLAKGNIYQRINACRILAEFAPTYLQSKKDDIVGLLVASLQGEPELRRFACRALGKLSALIPIELSPAVVKALLKQVDIRYPNVLLEASNALHKLEVTQLPEVRDELLEKLLASFNPANPTDFITVSQALLNLFAVIPAVPQANILAQWLALLENDIPQMFKFGCQMLLKLIEQQALGEEALFQQLLENLLARVATAKDIGNLLRRLIELSPATRVEAIMQGLNAKLDASSDMEQNAAYQLLVEMQARIPASEVRKLITKLSDRLAQSNFAGRITAAKAMADFANIIPDDMRELVVERLLEHKLEYLNEEGLTETLVLLNKAFAAHEPSLIAKVLLRKLEQGPNSVSDYAVTAMALLDLVIPNEQLAELVSHLLTTYLVARPQTACNLLAKLYPSLSSDLQTQVITRLTAALKDEDTLLRTSAIAAFAQLGEKVTAENRYILVTQLLNHVEPQTLPNWPVLDQAVIKLASGLAPNGQAALAIRLDAKVKLLEQNTAKPANALTELSKLKQALNELMQQAEGSEMMHVLPQPTELVL